MFLITRAKNPTNWLKTREIKLQLGSKIWSCLKPPTSLTSWDMKLWLIEKTNKHTSQQLWIEEALDCRSSQIEIVSIYYRMVSSYIIPIRPRKNPPLAPNDVIVADEKIQSHYDLWVNEYIYQPN